MSPTVEQVLAGQAQMMESINSWTEDDFAQADRDGPYVLRAAGVAKVLRDLQAGLPDPSAAQWWASFEFRPGEIDQLLAALRS